MASDKANGSAMIKLIRQGYISCAHDCSKGGLAVALSEMAMAGKTGFKVDMNLIPNTCTRPDDLLFSESHSRYLVGTDRPEEVEKLLKSESVQFARIGKASRGAAAFMRGKKAAISLSLARMEKAFGSLEKTMQG